MHQLGYVHCFDVWAPHKLSEKNLLDHICTCDSLLKHNQNVTFLKQIVTGNEKWILYNNVEWKGFWASEMKHHQPYQSQSSTKEGDVVYMVGLEWSPLLCVPSGKPNDEFQQVLSHVDESTAPN